MSKAPSMQFYPGDWQRDTGLKMCSLSARGLWAEMMWLMFDGEPYGHLSVKGSVIPPVKLAVMVGDELSVVEPLLAELEKYGVFSRTPEGVIFSRRMVRDAKRRETNALNGEKGGNPKLKGKSIRLSKSLNRKDNREVIPLRADAVAVADAIEEGSSEMNASAGLPFDSPAFAEAVASWEQHRREKRSILTPTSRASWLKRCAVLGEARSIKAIDHSIEKGYTGMYEPGNDRQAAMEKALHSADVPADKYQEGI